MISTHSEEGGPRSDGARLHGAVAMRDRGAEYAVPRNGLIISDPGCPGCNQRDRCVGAGCSPEELAQVERIIGHRRRLYRGEVLFRTRDPCEFLYAIKVGSLKSIQISEDGREQVIGFHMAGEIIGLDAIAGKTHTCNAVALEDSKVCAISLKRAGDGGTAAQLVQRNLSRAMSQEITREQRMIVLLSYSLALSRVASFLLNMSNNFESRGYSRSEFLLRMSRAEIGSFLGMTIETVSRSLSELAREGIIETDQRHLRILDMDRLRRKTRRIAMS